MRFLRLEMKRVLTTKMTWVLLAAALLFSVLMAYIPVTFEAVSYTDEQGRKIELEGRDAVIYLKNLRKNVEGEVTPEKVKTALAAYQKCLEKYGVMDTYELPDGADTESLMPYWDYMYRIRETFADSETGIAPALMEIDLDDVDNFYEKADLRLESLMKMEQPEHISAQKTAIAMYDEVKKPLQYYSGISADAMDYQVLLIYLIMILCVVIAAPIFTSDYQTGADDILRCTKYGRGRMAVCKILSSLLICGGTFLLCLSVWIGVTNTIFGWESTKTSLQFMFSISNLPNFNIGETQWICTAAAFVMFLAMLSFTLFVSAKAKSTVSSLAASLGFCILPVLITSIFPEELGLWMQCLLPAGGIGMGNSFLYALIDFKFLHLGRWSVWMPYALVFFAVIQIPVFLILAVRSHCKMRV